jgi:hypothetical protein
MNYFVLVFLLLIDGEMHLGVKVDDREKVKVFKTREACEEEKVQAAAELKTQLKEPFEIYCLTQQEYQKLVPNKGVTS